MRYTYFLHMTVYADMDICSIKQIYYMANSLWTPVWVKDLDDSHVSQQDLTNSTWPNIGHEQVNKGMLETLLDHRTDYQVVL